MTALLARRRTGNRKKQEDRKNRHENPTRCWGTVLVLPLRTPMRWGEKSKTRNCGYSFPFVLPFLSSSILSLMSIGRGRTGSLPWCAHCLLVIILPLKPRDGAIHHNEDQANQPEGDAIDHCIERHPTIPNGSNVQK